MGLITSLFRNLGAGAAQRRATTPSEVRDLIDKGRLDEASEALGRLSDATPELVLVRTCLEGEVAFRKHDDASAERLFREVLATAPGRGEAHYGLSLVMHARGEKETALRHAQFAVNTSKAPRCSAQLGLCQLELGNLAQAESSLARATRLDPNDKSSWNNLGIAYRGRNNAKKALRAFHRALEIDPGFEMAAANLGALEAELRQRGFDPAQVLHAHGEIDASGGELAEIQALARSGDLDEAISLCEQLCSEQADDALAVIELFNLYRDRGDTQSGLDALLAFLSRHPDDPDVLSAYGRGLVREHDFKRALPTVLRALEQRPDDIELLEALSDIRVDEGRYSDAGELVEKAFSLRPTFDMKGKLAASLIMRCQYERALAMTDEMIAERPEVSQDVAGMQVYALTHLGRHDEALPILERAIKEHPNDANRRFPRATIHLLNERFAEGWDDYAYRNLSSTRHLRMLPFPEWAGEPLRDSTLLVLADQGLGDQVMFASCLPDVLAQSPRRVIVEANSRVAKTLERSFPQCEVVPSRQDNAFEWVRELGHIDSFIAVGDLPRFFRRDRASFPVHGRPFLIPDPARVAHWRERLATLGSGMTIGLSWRGGTEQTRSFVRSLDVTQLAAFPSAFAAGRSAHFVCLQYGDAAADVERARGAGLDMAYWPEAIQDLDEFAALVAALDLVITVCNTTVHYAGALARPVWIMAPRVPEWRYGLRSTSLPWYPSSRIVRQPSDGDWQSVIDRMAADLRAADSSGVLAMEE